MKKLITTLVTVVLLMTGSIAAADIDLMQQNRAEQNYLIGVSSDNEGLRVSSAYFLGEMKSSKAVIPLMHMLRNEKSCNARLMAALSLIKIGDARGVYMVKKTAQFNNYERVRKMAHFLYTYYLKSTIEQADLDIKAAIVALNKF